MSLICLAGISLLVCPQLLGLVLEAVSAEERSSANRSTRPNAVDGTAVELGWRIVDEIGNYTDCIEIR